MSKTIEQQVEELKPILADALLTGKNTVQIFTQALQERDLIAREEERERMIRELQSIPLSYTIKSHEEDPYESNYIDVEDLNFKLRRLTTPLPDKEETTKV